MGLGCFWHKLIYLMYSLHDFRESISTKKAVEAVQRTPTKSAEASFLQDERFDL